MTYEEKVWDTFIRAMKGDLKAQAEILYVDAMLNGDNRLIKEENKMLNFDKYRESIMSEDVDTNELDCHIADLRGIKDCGDCECDACMRESFRWLFSEYEPPLLENGDGLKPGDWIMVRDGDGVSWRKRQFMCYFDNRFYCFKPHSQFKNECNCVMWAQARLPMEGE